LYLDAQDEEWNQFFAQQEKDPDSPWQAVIIEAKRRQREETEIQLAVGTH